MSSRTRGPDQFGFVEGVLGDDERVYIAYGDSLLIDTGLLATDGTPQGTGVVPLGGLLGDPLSDARVKDGVLFLRAKQEDMVGFELYKVEGTIPTLVRDLCFGVCFFGSGEDPRS